MKGKTPLPPRVPLMVLNEEANQRRRADEQDELFSCFARRPHKARTSPGQKRLPLPLYSSLAEPLGDRWSLPPPSSTLLVSFSHICRTLSPGQLSSAAAALTVSPSPTLTRARARGGGRVKVYRRPKLAAGKSGLQLVHRRCDAMRGDLEDNMFVGAFLSVTRTTTRVM